MLLATAFRTCKPGTSHSQAPRALLRAGGTLVIACWCQREETPEKPFTDKDRADLQFLYDEWAHPFFISYEEFGRLMEVGGSLAGWNGVQLS